MEGLWSRWIPAVAGEKYTQLYAQDLKKKRKEKEIVYYKCDMYGI